MSAGIDDPIEADRITAILQEWWQGDSALGVLDFQYLAEPGKALQPASVGLEETSFVGLETVGLVVVSQTCDIVKKCLVRPTLQVARLVSVTKGKLARIKRLQEPRFASIPGLDEKLLVADLDHIMTIEKSVLAGWERLPGCTTDDERRDLSSAIMRYYGRWAFPDKFNVEILFPFREYLRSLAGRQNPEEVAFANTKEFRVLAYPSWESAERIELLVIPEPDAPDDIDWIEWCNACLAAVVGSEAFPEIEVRAAELEELSAAEYLASEKVDFDGLS